MYLKRNPTTGDFLGSIPEVASTIVALGSRGWLREAAQVVGVNRMLGKGEGIWGCFLFCRRFSPFWLGISVVKIAFGFFPVKSRRDAECKPHRWDPLKLMSKVIRTAWWSCFGGFDYVHRYIMNYIYIWLPLLRLSGWMSYIVIYLLYDFDMTWDYRRMMVMMFILIFSPHSTAQFVGQSSSVLT